MQIEFLNWLIEASIKASFLILAASAADLKLKPYRNSKNN